MPGMAEKTRGIEFRNFRTPGKKFRQTFQLLKGKSSLQVA